MEKPHVPYIRILIAFGRVMVNLDIFKDRYATLWMVNAIPPKSCRMHHLVFTGFVAKGCPIEFLAVVLPQRHETIHVGNKPLVVMTLEQMNHFMDNDVL